MLLPAVESGQISLCAATTENPSFRVRADLPRPLITQIISALLSRCRVFTLNKLGVNDCVAILQRALRLHTADTIVLDDADATPPQIDEELLRFLATACDGDARVALSSLELALAATSASSSISRDDLIAGLRKAHLLYDRAGDSHFDTISALHVRRSAV